MNKKEKIECYKSINEIKKDLSCIKDLKKIKQRLQLSHILYKLVLLKEYGSLLEDNNIKVVLNHVFDEFINNLKNKNFYDDGEGNIINLSTDLEIFNVGFVKSKSLTSALDWLYNHIGYNKLYERTKECESKRVSLNDLYGFEISARKYIEENNLIVEENTNNGLKKYTHIDQFINEINLIVDLNKSSHRKLLVHIISKVCSLFDYEEYISWDVFRIITLEFSKLNIRTKNSPYREILKDNKNRKNVEKSILKEIFNDKNDIYGYLKYIKGILLTENENVSVEPLTIVDVVNLNESSSDYFNKKRNKYRSLKISTGN